MRQLQYPRRADEHALDEAIHELIAAGYSDDARKIALEKINKLLDGAPAPVSFPDGNATVDIWSKWAQSTLTYLADHRIILDGRENLLDEVSESIEETPLRYSPDQPRDEHGRFGEGSGEDTAAKGYDPNAAETISTIKAWQMPDTGRAVIDAAGEAAKAGDKSNPIVNGIRNEVVKGALYRGLSLTKDDPIAKWKEGDEVQILPSSFSRKEDVAGEFAFQRMTDLNNIAVVLRISGGKTNGMDIAERGDPDLKQEKEVITGGRFIVTGVRPTGAASFEIRIKQYGVF